MQQYELIHDDVIHWANNYTDKPYHALLTDSPYNLESITKRFGADGAAKAKHGKDGAFARASGGFMNAKWDTDIAFKVETWVALTKHLLPGGWGMAFAGSRGWHRMAVAIEDAGMIIHPTIFLWGYGSGFPKATRVDDQIDSAAGKIQSTIGTRQHQPKFAAADFEYREKDNGFNSKDRLTFDITAPATDLAAAWSGHRYGGQAIKPATEPIIVFQKPYAQVSCESIREVTGWDHWCVTSELDSDAVTRYAAKWGIELPATGTVYQIACKALHAGVQSDIQYWQDDTLLHIVNVKPFRAWATDNSVACMLVTRGAGAINIDAGRIGTATDKRWPVSKSYAAGQFQPLHNGETQHTEHDNTGRWPANLILSHNPDCEHIGTKRVRGTKGEADPSPGKPALIAAGCAGGTHKTGRHHADSDGLETVDEWACSEGCAVARLGMQSGDTYTDTRVRKVGKNGAGGRGVFGDYAGNHDTPAYQDSGTAARYFYNSEWMYERLEAADPVIYRAKSSTAERDGGLDKCETLTIELKGEAWAQEGQKVTLLVDTVTSQPKVIGAFTIPTSNAIEWNTMLFGSFITALSPTDIKYITKMKTKSTTPLKTLNWLTRSLTNESIADASCDQMDGGNLAVSADQYITSITFTNTKPVCVPGVGNVASGTHVTMSVSESCAPIVVDDGREKSIDNAYQRGETIRRNPHPTLKNVSLTKHLASLLLPPDIYAGERRLLVPFSGVSSEMIGALLAGWDHVTGIELEEKHVKVGNIRLAKWQEVAEQLRTAEPDVIVKTLTKASKAVDTGQRSLFDLDEAA